MGILGKSGIFGTGTSMGGGGIVIPSNGFKVNITGEGGLSSQLSLVKSAAVNVSGEGGLDADLHNFKSLASNVSGEGGLDGTLTVGGFIGLLDDYPNAAAAYSLRLLKSDYTGALVEIRRSSDNAVKTFYPDANNEFSLTSEDGSGTSLSSWITTDNGFVRTWYDQSGNANNATQTTASLQSQIVASGALINVNSKPSIDFDGNDYYNLTTPITPINVINVSKIDASGIVNYLLWSTTLSKGYYLYGGAVSNNVGIFDGGVKSAFANDLNQHLNYYYYNGTNFQVSQDGGAETALASGANFSINMIGRSASNFSLNGKNQELIIYAEDKSSDKSGILDNINTYYSIY